MSTTAAHKVSSPPHSDGAQVVVAGEGDHYAIHHFLRQAVQQPSDDEFAAQVDRPGYASADRLLIVEGGRIVSHLLRTRREIAYGDTTFPVVELSDLVTAPDCRGRGYASLLLDSAVAEMEQQDVLLGSLRTDVPAIYQRRGWTMGSRHTWSIACPRDVLSRLSARNRNPRGLKVRLWRQVEQAALMRLHEQACREGFGHCLRAEEEWRWLVSRGACDRVYVVVDGEADTDFDASDSIVAFAFMQGGRIVELAGDFDHTGARREILRRVCSDAIESGHLEVRLDAPCDDPLHQLLEESGGRRYHVEAERGLVNLVRVISMQRLLTQLAETFWQRALESEISRPGELGLSCETGRGTIKLRIVVAKNCVQIAAGKVGRSYLSGSLADLQQLVLGRLSLAEVLNNGRIEASTQTAVDLATALLPELPLFRSVLDDLPAAHTKP